MRTSVGFTLARAGHAAALAGALAATLPGSVCCRGLGSGLELVRAVGKPLSTKKIDFKIKGYALPASAGSGRAAAGAFRIEITPPPGYPNGGDGPAGGVSRGVWTKLYARAVYFEDAAGVRVVLVSCDLFAIPESLPAAVARIYNTDPATLRQALPPPLSSGSAALPPLPPERIVLAATHTHQGPGNFMAAATQNMFGSPYSGFDRALFEHLARRIATAVAGAVLDAAAHASEPARVRIRSGTAYDSEPASYLRNRAPQAFELDPDRDEVMAAVSPVPASVNCSDLLRCLARDGSLDAGRHAGERCEPPVFWGLADCARVRAVDPRMTLLEVLRGGRRVALLVFFAAHPTVLLPDAPIYSSDFTGVAVSALENRWKAAGGGPVVAFFNGAEGDITTRRIQRDLRETRRFGELMTASIERVLAAPAADEEIRLSVATGDAAAFYRPAGKRPPGRRCSLDPADPPVALASTPQFGVAGIGGAEDDRTILYDLGWREDVRGQPADGQGPKFPGLDVSVMRGIRISKILAPPESFPGRLPVTDVRIASLEIGALPVEMTTAMARRVRRALALPEDRFVFVGLADDYADYCASPDEYVAQEYAGASTIWGPNEGPVLGCMLRDLRAAPPPASPLRVGSLAVHPGTVPLDQFGYVFCGEPRNAPDEELGKILRDAEDRPARDLPFTTWTDLADDDADVRTPVFSVRMLRLGSAGWEVRKAADGTPDSTEGFNFVVTLMDAGKAGVRPRRWAAIWISPVLEGTPPPGSYRFAVEHGGSTRCSAPFEPSSPRPGGRFDVGPATEPCPS